MAEDNKKENNFSFAEATEDTWKKKLTPEQYQVLREKGTEIPFTGKYLHTKDKGIYKCAACGNQLFSSETKFDSGTGWPSFTEPMNPPTGGENIELKEDQGQAPPLPNGFGRASMIRTEVLCKKCGSHLGHVFDDLPADSASVATLASPEPSAECESAKGAVLMKAGGHAPNRGRYCINSVCLEFEPSVQKQDG